MEETKKEEIPDSFTYTIGGKKYTQSKLVLAQIKQLEKHIQGTKIPGSFNVTSIIELLGDKINKAIAIVLREDGQKLKKKDVDQLTEMLEDELEFETLLEIVDNFFFCNPVASLWERFGNLAESITENMEGIMSKNLSLSSAEEILPNETESSGDIPLKSADLTSNIVVEK